MIYSSNSERANLIRFFRARVSLDQDGADGDASVIVADENRGVDLEWTVGGAFQVDSTQVTVMAMMIMAMMGMVVMMTMMMIVVMSVLMLVIVRVVVVMVISTRR